MNTLDAKSIAAICRILNRGNTAEIRPSRGKVLVCEVERKIRTECLSE